MSSVVVLGVIFGASGRLASFVRRTWFTFTLLVQFSQAKGSALNVVGVDETLAVGLSVHKRDVRGTSPVRVLAPSRLHRPPSVEAGNAVCGNAIFFVDFAVKELATVRVVSGKVEEVYSREDNQESAKERNSVHRVRGIKAFEKNKRRAKSCRSEGDVV